MYRTRYRRFVFATVFAASAFALLRGAAPQVDTGTWRATGPLGSARAGAASALLPDGTLLVTGGAGPDGTLSTTEVLGSSGAFSPAASMNAARSDHGAVALSDGRVLVVGGRNADNALASAEIYSDGEWFPAGDLTDARWGHTTTLLADGRVLIAGGENGAGVLASVELFDPYADTFSVIGTLSSPRKGHAAARLADGRVLIAGGFSGDAVLASIDVFDPETESIAPLGLSLGSPRAGLSATTLLDGRVLLVGGNDGSDDLATSEVFDAATGTITAGPSSAVGRRDHEAFLLPNNNAVLVVGGATADGLNASATLYLPWLNQFWPTAAPAASRYRATGSALSTESYGVAPDGAGVLAVVGGEGQSSSELYGFATISVDKNDYSPGETVYVSGRGWQPGDVTFELREVVAEHTARLFTLTADEHGVIPTQALFLVEQHHLGVRFYLTARDAASQAQITFTDGNATSVSGTVVSSASGNPPISGATITCSSGCNATPAPSTASGPSGGYVFDNTTTKLSFNTNGPVTLQLTASKTGFASQTITLANVNTGAIITGANFTLAPAVANTTVTASFASGTYGGSTTLSARLTSGTSGVGGKILTFSLNGTSVGTAITNGAGTATLDSVSLSGITAGTYTGGVRVSFAGDSGFSASNGIASLTVNALSVNLTGTRTYDGTSTAAASILSVVNIVGSDAVTVTSGNAALSGKDSGTRTITSVAGLTLGGANAANYTLTGASGTVTITARPVAFTGTRGYDGTADATASILTISNAAAGDTVNVASGTATLASKTAGAQAITNVGTLALGDNGSGNYTLSGASGTVTITARAVTLTGTRAYDGTPDVLANVLSVGNAVVGDTVNVASGSATLASKDIGVWAITNLGSLALGNNDAGNYTLTGATGTVAIAGRPITFTVTDITRVYGESTPAFDYSVTSGSIVNGDTFGTPSFSVPASTVGTHTITPSGLANPNYEVTIVAGTLTVTPRPITFAANDVTRVYGESTPEFSYSIKEGTIVNDDAFGTPAFTVAGTNVGTHTITLGGLENPNYTVSFETGNLTVTPRPITVSADAQTKMYGEADAEFGYKVTNGSLVNGDAFSGVLNREQGQNVGTYAIEQGTLALSANYTLSYIGANLTITARPITVTADAKAKVYGDGEPGLTYQVTTGSVVQGDSFTGSLERAPGGNVGTYAIQQGTLALNSNYLLTYVGASFTISPRPITVTADSKAKVYGSPDPDLAYQVTNGTLVSGDSFTGALTRAAGQNVGTYAIQQGSLALTSNYSLTFAGASLAITPAELIVRADDKQKVYDGTPFTAFTSTITGFVNGDTGAVVSGAVSYQGSATTAVNPGNTYTITPVTSGLTAANYTFTAANGTLSIIFGTCSPAVGFGGVVLPPINSDGTSVYQRKGGSTIPVKFRVCAASGQSISNPAAVFAGTGGQLTMLSAVRGTIETANEAAINDIPDVAFRWDASGQQWIFNMATANLESGSTYVFRVNLANGSIPFRVGVK